MSFCLNGGTTTINLGVKGTKVLTTSEIENFMSTDSSGNVSFDAKAFGNYLAGIKALGDGNSSKAVQYFEKSNMLGKLNSTELQTLISNLTGLDLENFNLKYQDVNGNYDFANGGVLTTGMASAKLGENSFKGIVDLLSEYGKQKYGLDNYGITVLSEYLKTGNSGSITRQNNLRTIVESIDKKELASFLDNYTRNFNSFNIQSCVSQLDAYGLARDWGSNYGRTALKEYLTTGNVCVITSQGNLRNIVSSIAPNDLLQMYNRYFGDNLQINNKSSVLSLGSINLNSNNITLVNDYYNEFFKFNGNLDDATFGVDQAAIEKLCDYYIDGQKMSYYSAMKIINECKKQGKPLPKVKKIGSDEYFRLKDKLVSMGFSPSDASVIMSTVNYAGACSYASVANEIFCSFSRNPVLFKQKFGYDMYTIDANGNKTLNSAELLLDMYVHCNMKKNGGGFIEKSMFSNRYSLSNKYLTGEIDVFGRSMLDAGNQVYLSTIPGGKRVTPINSFLQAHGLSYSSECIYYNKPNSKLDDYQMNSIIDEINRRIQSGSVVSMDISSRGREIRMVSTNQDIYNSESTWTWKEGGAHSIYVTGIANDGFVVSSWGREYIIPFSDLKNGGSFQITLSAVYNNK